MSGQENPKSLVRRRVVCGTLALGSVEHRTKRSQVPRGEGPVSAGSDPLPSTHLSLLSRLRDGSDQQAWSDFEARYRELVLRFCRRKGLQAADAEDVAQGVFFSLSRALPGFIYDPSSGRFRDYLFRCVRNAIFHWSKCPDRGLLQLDTNELLSNSNGVVSADEEQAWEAEWAAHHYRRALARLRETGEERAVRLLERSFDGVSVDSLAAEFELSVEGVYKARQRARQRLQALVAEQIREEDEFSR